MTTTNRFRLTTCVFLLALLAWTSAATAVTVEIDFSTDTSDFFGAGNPQGETGAAQAKAALEAAADYYSGVLKDTFSAVDVPEKFYGSLGGEASWFWTRRFIHPVTGLNNAMLNDEVMENKYVVFVGARDLLGDDVGRAGAGGFVGGHSSRSGLFTAAEETQLAQMDAAFASATKRGQASGFARWGGSASFDSLTTWHFDHTTSPGAGTTDFYSVALHELGHVFGLGTSEEWDKLVIGTNFTGAKVKSIFGNTDGAPLASGDAANSPGDDGHWLQSIAMSPVYEGAGTQTPLMVPVLQPAQTRRNLTNLDAAALADIGWEIDLPGAAAAAASFVSTSGSSGSTAIASLSASVVPEPTGTALLAMAAVFLVQVRSQRIRSRSGRRLV